MKPIRWAATPANVSSDMGFEHLKKLDLELPGCTGLAKKTMGFLM